MVVGAGAAFSDQSKIKNTEAVDMCVALNIIGGYPDGSYKPEGNITRAEFAKMICVLLNGGTTPATATNTTPTFNDVRGNANAAWAEGFIEYCYAKGIVSGVGGGKFAPNGNVTATEAAKMLLVALGYNATVENYTGASWALKVNVQANQDGLYKGLETIDTGAALTRDNAAQMVWNALQAYVIDKSSSIDRTDGSVTDIYTKNTTVDLIAKMYDGIIAKGELSAFEYNSKDAKWTYTVKLTEPRTIRENNGEFTTVYYVDVVSKTDYTALLGQKVKAVYKYDKNAKENTVYGIFSVDSNVVLTGLIGDLPKMTKSDDTSFKMNGETYKLQSGLTLATVPVYQFTTSAETALFKVDTEKKDSNSNTIYRGSALWDVAGQYAKADKVDGINVAKGDNITKYDAQKFTAVDKDGNGKIDFFMVVPFSVKKVTYVSSTQFALAGGSKTDLDDVTAYKGMARDDYVIYTAKENTANDTATLVKADLVSGKITSTDSPNAKIGDNWYTFDFSYGSNITTNCKPGNELKDAVVVNGYIFDVDKVNKTAITDFAVVIATEAGGVNGNRAKLLFSDGKKEVVSTDKNYKDGTVKVGDTNVSIAIQNGTLVTYSKNADGEYILTTVTAGTNGYDLDQAYSSVKKVSNNSDKIGYINGASVNDDAVIFVNYKGTSYKVITGAQLKKIATDDVADSFAQGLVVGSKDGNTYNVEMAYISLGSKDVNDADTYYGYITGVTSTKNDDQQTVDVVKVWTNEGEKTYEFANTSVTYKYPTDKDAAKKLLKAGSVIEFKLNDKDKINEIVGIYDVDATQDTTSGVTPVTVTGTNTRAATIAISALTPTFQFNMGGTSTSEKNYVQTVGTNKFFELDKDTVYLYIENSDQIGVDAKDQSLNTASKNQDGSLMLNAFVLYDNTDGSVKLVVYDVDGDIAE